MRAVLDRVRRFTNHPATRLATGLILVVCSIAEGYDTFFDDVRHGRLRAHHGLLIFGLMNMLRSMPDFVEGLESATEALAAGEGLEVAEEDFSRGGPSPPDRHGDRPPASIARAAEGCRVADGAEHHETP
ncbi:hypothetical protein [Paludisphaera sp.]|uniref:hypothetical protein n=1 Tax=Paludisphaera sp. TaxID=2017432 RepID=UPI00301DEC34